MIQIITGKLGAGKTLYTVMEMFDSLCLGRICVTNIAVNWPAMVEAARRLRRVHLREEQLIRLDPGTDANWQESIPFGSLNGFVEVYLDEIHLFFNARDWAKTNSESKGLLSFLTQSRKARVNVTFIAQEASTVEKQFRVLAEWEKYIVNSDHMPLGILGKFPFKFFIIVQRDAQNSCVLKRTYRGYDKRFFKLYGSYTFLDAEMNNLAANAVWLEPYKLAKVSLFRWVFLEPVRPLVLWWRRRSMDRLDREKKLENDRWVHPSMVEVDQETGELCATGEILKSNEVILREVGL